MSESLNNSNNTPVIKCESVYKIFGNNASKLLESSNGEVDAKTFQEVLKHYFQKFYKQIHT